MNQSSFSKSELARQVPPANLIWKKNDSKAQKNGPHSNIYWVKVLYRPLRNNLSTKTAARNRTNGKVPTNTWEIGRTTKSKASASSTMPTGISTKVGGQKTKGTDKAPTGSLTPRTG